MSCDIHAVYQIRTKDGWKPLEEDPGAILNNAGYGTYAVLNREVRNYFGVKGFPERGLPDDIGALHFQWCSKMEYIRDKYDNGEEKCVRYPDGHCKSVFEYMPELYREISEEEYLTIRRLSNEGAPEYLARYYCLGEKYSGDKKVFYVYDANIAGGKIEAVPNSERYPTVEAYAAAEYSDDWDDEAQDYGNWRVSFDSEDYHSASWLSLQDLLDWDSTEYTTIKYKLDRSFYEAFVKAGGVFPDCFSVDNERSPADVVDAIREALSPTIIVSWPNDSEKVKDYPMFRLIREMKRLAEQYNVSAKDIRIVFAFDNWKNIVERRNSYGSLFLRASYSLKNYEKALLELQEKRVLRYPG